MSQENNDHSEKHEEGRVTHDIHHQFVEEHHKETSTRTIWITFWILLVVTMLEVGIAFTSVPRAILIWIFIALTLVKAYYIVFNFMHLGHERKPLIYSILLPFVLIIYLIVIALYEGSVLDIAG